jgi:ABC-type multidrug transport system fused ATPase/permease subunit
MGVVPQAPILFDDTIMNNVRYAKLTATDEEVFNACKAASIHDQIMGFSDGKLRLFFLFLLLQLTMS